MCVYFENYLKMKYILKKMQCPRVHSNWHFRDRNDLRSSIYVGLFLDWVLVDTFSYSNFAFRIAMSSKHIIFCSSKTVYIHYHVLKSANFFVHFKITLKANLDTIQIHQQRDRAKRALRKLNFLVLVLCISFQQQQQQQNSKH